SGSASFCLGTNAQLSRRGSTSPSLTNALTNFGRVRSRIIRSRLLRVGRSAAFSTLQITSGSFQGTSCEQDRRYLPDGERAISLGNNAIKQGWTGSSLGSGLDLVICM